jgi:hypothetical protein
VGTAHDGSEPPAKRAKSIEAPPNLVSVLSDAEPMQLERVRHTGGVVEGSAVRGERRIHLGSAYVFRVYRLPGPSWIICTVRGRPADQS